MDYLNWLEYYFFGHIVLQRDSFLVIPDSHYYRKILLEASSIPTFWDDA